MHIDSPLSELLRPDSIETFCGQEHILNDASVLYKMINNDTLTSFILFGPPGCGKTTLANIIKKMSKSPFHSLSAVTTGIKDVKEIMKSASEVYNFNRIPTILFVDEIHRFNKAQQDAFLSYIEQGAIVLIGATTENPSFSVISPLLSRMRVFQLKPLDDKSVRTIITRAIDYIFNNLKIKIIISEEKINDIIAIASGDSRRCLGLLDLALRLIPTDATEFEINNDILKEILSGRMSSYDKSGDIHYDHLSALHKSMRDSDVHAALFYAVRMLESGEDPLVIMRRVIQCASEDIGLADPQALILSNAALDTIKNIGMPEARFAILEAVAYNSLAPKSNSLYTSYVKIAKDIHEHPDLQIPLHIKNAPTKLMKEIGNGRNYQYAHDYNIPVTDMNCLPDKIKEKKYYFPKEIGFEKKLKDRLDKIDSIKKK